jgi:hypothetical protein
MMKNDEKKKPYNLHVLFLTYNTIVGVKRRRRRQRP